MKLNLLPTDVSKAGASTVAWIVSGLMVLASVAAAGGMAVVSAGSLEAAKQAAADKMQLAADAKVTADQAEKQIAEVTVIDRNQKLSIAMDEHNRKYVDLYRDILRYVPSYYRITSMTAAPTGENASQVILTGQLQSFRQYADLAIAMWKVPDVVSVSREGYAVIDPVVPALSETDQTGRAIRPDEAPIPDDWEGRMNALMAQAAAQPQGFQNASGFGTQNDLEARGPMPQWSTVTMRLSLAREMRTPDPRATILSGGSAGALGVPGAPGAPAGGPAPSGFGQVGGPPPGGGGRGGAGR